MISAFIELALSQRVVVIGLSLVLLMMPVLVPPLFVNVTVSEPVVRLLPAASLALSVSVTRLPEATEPPETVSVEVLIDAGPGVTDTVGKVELSWVPPTVA